MVPEFDSGAKRRNCPAAGVWAAPGRSWRSPRAADASCEGDIPCDLEAADRPARTDPSSAGEDVANSAGKRNRG